MHVLAQTLTKKLKERLLEGMELFSSYNFKFILWLQLEKEDPVKPKNVIIALNTKGIFV